MICSSTANANVTPFNTTFPQNTCNCNPTCSASSIAPKDSICYLLIPFCYYIPIYTPTATSLYHTYGNLIPLYLCLIVLTDCPEHCLSGIYTPMPHIPFSLFNPFSLRVCRGNLMEGFVQRVGEGRRRKAGREERDLAMTRPCN